MSQGSENEATWFIVPGRIMNLPNLTMQFLRVYETIFQFWNKGRACFLSNKMIMERTGIKSESTVKEAFLYFEKHKELLREVRKGKRYLIQPPKELEFISEPEKVEKFSKNDCTNFARGADAAAGGGRRSGGGGADAAAHNINNLNKEFKRERENLDSKHVNDPLTVPALSLSETFKPSEELIEYIYTLDNLTDDLLNREHVKFMEYYYDSGKTSINWEREYKMWMLKASQYYADKRKNG